MKNFLIKKSMNYIKKNTSYNDVKLKEIKYGLEGIYLTFSKLIIIITISLLLNIFEEVILYLLIYNVLRIFSFGLHATKSWICLLSSSLLFIGIPMLCLILNINIIFKIIVSIVGTILMFKNSPADTKKRPIINKKRRRRLKYCSTIITIIFSIIMININNNFLSNCLFFAIIMQNCMISPITYKIFHLPYNNYLEYLKKHPELN